MSYIKIDNVTKKYKNDRGIFDIDIEINKGETIGFIGTNGAGKTTTIRVLMGFIKPTKGTATIDGMDCWKDSMQIKKLIGYVPGEIAFPDEPTGETFLKRQSKLNNTKSLDYTYEIVDKLQLDPTANLKRMSKGMKQKTAIAEALMDDSEILILDEPTTGLDPLMRMEFIDIIKEQQRRGKTIFMSSHIFEEIEDVCDRVFLIKDGYIVADIYMNDIRHRPVKTYKIELKTDVKAEEFAKTCPFKILKRTGRIFTIEFKDEQTNEFLQLMRNFQVRFFSEVKYTLENYFDDIYVGGKKDV